MLLAVCGRLGRYKESMFIDLLRTESYLLEGKPKDYFFEGVTHDFKVKVEYLGVKRKISKDKKIYLGRWLYSHGMDKSISDLFIREILVKEGKEKYWVIVQEALLQDMEKELKTGDYIWLFAQLWGSVNKEYVMIVCRWDGPTEEL